MGDGKHPRGKVEITKIVFVVSKRYAKSIFIWLINDLSTDTSNYCRACRTSRFHPF